MLTAQNITNKVELLW